jgi:uncharacterized protein YecT (DUF1311 family)
MKHLLTILFLSLSMLLFGQTQAEINTEANESYKKADKELNEIYQKILSEYKSDVEFIKNLKTSQKIWITFRNAELKMKYPDRDPGYYGSIHPLCVANYLEQLTWERIKTLKTWLNGVEEGDACCGSIKSK